MPIACAICGRSSQRISPAHVKTHGLTVAQYQATYPDAPIVSPELSARLSAIQQEVQRTPEARARMSASCKRVEKTPAWNQKNSEGQRGKIIPEDVRDKMSGAAKRRIARDGDRLRSPAAQARLHVVRQTPEFKRAVAEGQARSFANNGFNGLNDRVARTLSVDMDLLFEREFLFPGVTFYTYDFAFPDLKVILEIQGCRWHACPEHTQCWQNMPPYQVSRRKAIDKAKKTYAESQGWVVYQVWEHDLPEEQAFCTLVDILLPHLEKAAGMTAGLAASPDAK